MKNIIVVFLAIVVTACASSRGFDRGSLRSQITDQKVVTEEDIKKALEARPQLPNPFKLAIYFAPPKTPQWQYRGSWNWLGEDKDKLLGLNAELKAKGVVSDIFAISDAIVEGKDNKAIRLAAAQAGADAVLVVNGVSDVDRYNNPLGATYVLLVTAFFVPGTQADGLFMANASMWDVRNQYLYLSVEAEGSAKETRPAFFIEESRIVKAAKADALAELGKQLSTRLTILSRK